MSLVRSSGWILASAALVLGCGHGTAEDRQLVGMQDEVNHIEKDRDRTNRKDDPDLVDTSPERSGGRANPPPRSQVAPRAPEEGPPGDGADGDDPNDTSPRPSIRITGSPGARGRGRGAHGGGGNETIEANIPDDASNGGTAGPAVKVNASSPSALDENARHAYDAALALVNGHQYDRALEAFSTFLVRWPDHPNADNAMYWRGECYFAKGEYARAAEEFDGTIARFPLGNKVPDALLKLGICHQKLGNQAKAKTYFDRLLRDFPRSEAARRVPHGDAATSSRRPGPQENP